MKKLFKWLGKVVSIIATLLMGATAPAAKPNKYDENHFNVRIAMLLGGNPEVRIKHNRRADIITPTYAIETDWLPKAWSEGVGQSLAYAELTNRKPGIVVIIDINKRRNEDQLALVKMMAKKLKIKLWFYECDRQLGTFNEVKL